MPACVYACCAARRVMSKPTPLIMLSSKLFGRSVVSACPAISTLRSRPCLRANSAETTSAAAAPQVGGQHCSRVSMPKTCGDASTSSTVVGSRNTASGLRDCMPRAT